MGLVLAASNVLILAALAGFFGHREVAPLTGSGRVLEWLPSANHPGSIQKVSNVKCQYIALSFSGTTSAFQLFLHAI